MTVRQALIADCFFEAAGALSMGPSVAGTISSGEVHVSKWQDSPSYFGLLMFSVLVGAGSTTLLATMYGLPISATHGVISGVIACALVSETSGALKNGDAVNWWPGFGMTVFGWVASPIVGMLAGMVVSYVVYKLIIGTENPAKSARKQQPTLLAGTAALVISFLIIKGPEFLSSPFKGKSWLAILIAIAGGGCAALALLAYQHLQQPDQSADSEDTAKDPGSPREPADEDAENASPSDSAPGASQHIFDDVQKPFVPLLIAAGLTVAFAHGGNDIGNAVGPLSTLLYIHQQNPHAIPSDDDEDAARTRWSAIIVCTLALVAGIMTLGSRTIETVGNSITELTPSRSFATQIGAGIAVLVSSTVDLPVSTTHCLVGAVVGVNMMEGWCKVDGAKDLDFKVLKKVVLAWVVTIPLAAGVSVIVLLLLQKAYIG